MRQNLPLHATVAAAVLALNPGGACAQQTPTDVELKAAYCLAVTKKQIEGMEQAKVSDAYQRQYVTTMLSREKDRLQKLELYLTPRMQTLEPTAIVATMNGGEADYANYNQRMSEVAPSCIINCDVLTATGEAQGNAKQCLGRCVEGDALIARVNACSTLDWLAF